MLGKVLAVLRRRELWYESEEPAIVTVCHQAGVHPIDGRLTHISQSGFRMHSRRPIRPGSKVRVQVANAVAFGKVRRCSASHPDGFDVAIHTQRVVMRPGIANVKPAAEPVDVLLVEDNPGDVKLTELMLDRVEVPHRLSVAMDGEQAVARLSDPARPTPGLMLLDLNLPRMDGFEVLERIRARNALRSIPVVAVLSTGATDSDIRRSRQFDVRAYFQKPRDFRDYEHLSVKVGALLTEVHLRSRARTAAAQ